MKIVIITLGNGIPGTCQKQFLFTNSVFNINKIALIAMAAETSIMGKALVN